MASILTVETRVTSSLMTEMITSAAPSSTLLPRLRVSSLRGLGCRHSDEAAEASGHRVAVLDKHAHRGGSLSLWPGMVRASVSMMTAAMRTPGHQLVDQFDQRLGIAVVVPKLGIWCAV